MKRKGEKSSYKIGYCKNCSEEFVARSDTDQAFCSVSCQSKYNWKTGKIIPKNSNCKIDFICEQCNGIFVDFQSNNRRFCSKECFAEFNHGEKTLRKCLKCKCEFEMYVSALKTNATGNYCSRKCYEEALRGENFQELRRRNLGTAKWRKIRDSILKRMPICPVCFNKKDLNIHHIIPFRITEDDSEKNLIPLCRSCHGKFESLTRFCELAKIPWDYFYIFMKSYYLDMTYALRVSFW